MQKQNYQSREFHHKSFKKTTRYYKHSDTSYKITRVAVLTETELALKDAYMYDDIYIVHNREQLNKGLL